MKALRPDCWPTTQKHLRSLASRVCLWADQRGSVAIEFAIALPLLILILFGLIEFRSSFLVKQRTIIAATTMSNIVAEHQEVNHDLIDNLEEIAQTILFPHETSAIEVSVAVVTYNGVSLVIEWQDSSTGEPFPPEIADDMLTGLLFTQEKAVITDIRVIREPVIGGAIPGLQEFNERHIAYPSSDLSYGGNAQPSAF